MKIVAARFTSLRNMLASGNSLSLPASKQTHAIHRLAANMRIKDDTRPPIANGLNRRNNIKKRVREVSQEDSDVASASPLILSGNINMALNTMFSARVSTETFAGVTVSFSAKKHDCMILAEAYAVRPML